jgi:hypothetical protein
MITPTDATSALSQHIKTIITLITYARPHHIIQSQSANISIMDNGLPILQNDIQDTHVMVI